jgi:dienelactone hydrolase
VATRVAQQLSKDYESVQGVGFCIGARLVMNLIRHSPSSLLKAGVLYHPTFLTADDAPAVRVPLLFNCASREEIFTPDLRKQFETELAKAGLGTFIDYPGTEHGFGARPEGEQAHKSSAEAANNSIAFFTNNK